MKKIILISFLLAFVLVNSAKAAVFKLPMDAVKEEFPDATEVEIKNVILTPEQVSEIGKLSKIKVKDRLISFYLGKKGSEILGFGVFDTHIVRTKPETFLLIIDKEGRVKDVKVIAFYEPLEYLPPQKWLNLMKGKELNDKLRLKVGMPSITGATMSSQAVVEAIRRNLAIFKVIFGENGK